MDQGLYNRAKQQERMDQKRVDAADSESVSSGTSSQQTYEGFLFHRLMLWFSRIFFSFSVFKKEQFWSKLCAWNWKRNFFSERLLSRVPLAREKGGTSKQPSSNGIRDETATTTMVDECRNGDSKSANQNEEQQNLNQTGSISDQNRDRLAVRQRDWRTPDFYEGKHRLGQYLAKKNNN